MEKPKYHNLEDENGPEKVLGCYKDYGTSSMQKAMGVIETKRGLGYSPPGIPLGHCEPGALFITNHRIIHENLDNGNNNLSIPHNVIDSVRGTNSGFFGNGNLTIIFDDGTIDEGIAIYNGETVADYLNSTFYTKKVKTDRKMKTAKFSEKHLDYDNAIVIYEEIGKHEDAARVRKLKAEQGAVKVTQKVVHGDEVTKTEIKDSVLNRSNVGGGSSKAEELREAKSLFEEGLIDDAEFKQMKKEILKK